MTDSISNTMSVVALMISAITAWLTLFRRGTIKMTQPTTVFFGPDAGRSRDEPTMPKIYLRTLLFSTSKRGRVIESMYVSISRNETTQNFSIWVYGGEKLVRGSGLFIGETGLAANHHFLMPRGGNSFHFTEGSYRLAVYAHLLGDRTRTLLFSHTFEISRDMAMALADPQAGVYFDWGPDSLRYLSFIEKHPLMPKPGLESVGFKQPPAR